MAEDDNSSSNAYCPMCLKEGRKNLLNPVFEISGEAIRSINPIFPDADKIKKIFQQGQIADVAYCEYGHGLQSLKTHKKLVHV